MRHQGRASVADPGRKESSAPKCPICAKPVTTPAFRPFCSSRCADVDLQRWFTGAYAIPVVESEDETDEEREEGR